MQNRGYYKEAIKLHKDALRQSPEKLWLYEPLIDCMLLENTYSKQEWNILYGNMLEALKTYGPIHNITTRDPEFPLVVPGRGIFYHSLYISAEQSHDFTNAWNYLKISNNLEDRRSNRYEKFNTEEIQHIMNVFSQISYEGIVPPVSDEIIFVTGLPNSGFKYVEKVLNEHPSLFCLSSNRSLFDNSRLRYSHLRDSFYGIFMSNLKLIQDTFEEYHYNILEMQRLNILSKLRDLLMPQWVQSAFVRAQDSGRDPNRLRYIVDSHHFLYRYLGYIHILYPKALIINIVKDPMDGIFNIFRYRTEASTPHSYLATTWTYHLPSATSEYFTHLVSMAFWRKDFPDRIIDISSAQLYSNPQETITSKILNRLGLSWTESMDQISRQYYLTPKDQWRQYSNHMANVFNQIYHVKLTRAFLSDYPDVEGVNWDVEPTVWWGTPAGYREGVEESSSGTAVRAPTKLIDIGEALSALRVTRGVYVLVLDDACAEAWSVLMSAIVIKSEEQKQESGCSGDWCTYLSLIHI